MSKRVLCKFFAHGACLKGDHCEFSHDWKAPPNNACTFYQKGACAYGSRCRYEHVKVSRPQTSAPSSSVGLSLPGVIGNAGCSTDDHSSFAWGEQSELNNVLGTDDTVGQLRSVGPDDQSICSYAAAGDCPRGEKCPHIHGDLCPHCGKQCLHPFRSEEREEHLKVCQKRQSQLDALRNSQDIECSVCLERVLSKATAGERKFGILSECDHAFCISCIRNWRNNPASGIDVNSALRACPICRKLSYFVIPSIIWYTSKEKKQEIVDNYMAKLRSIDCKHFDFGNGTCPFGTSCFYKLRNAVKVHVCPLKLSNRAISLFGYLHEVKPGPSLGNDSLNPDLYSSGLQGVIGIDSSIGIAAVVFKPFLNEPIYSPHIPIENDNEDGLPSTIIGEVMALSLLQSDSSDCSND